MVSLNHGLNYIMVMNNDLIFMSHICHWMAVPLFSVHIEQLVVSQLVRKEGTFHNSAAL